MKKSSLISVYNESQRTRDTNRLQPLFQKKFDTTDFRKPRTAAQSEASVKSGSALIEDSKQNRILRNPSDARVKPPVQAEFNFSTEANRN